MSAKKISQNAGCMLHLSASMKRNSTKDTPRDELTNWKKKKQVYGNKNKGEQRNSRSHSRFNVTQKAESVASVTADAGSLEFLQKTTSFSGTPPYDNGSTLTTQ